MTDVVICAATVVAIGAVAWFYLWSEKLEFRALGGVQQDVIYGAERAAQIRARYELADRRWRVARKICLLVVCAVIGSMFLTPFAGAVIVALWIANAVNECANERAARLESELRALRAEMRERA